MSEPGRVAAMNAERDCDHHRDDEAQQREFQPRPADACAVPARRLAGGEGLAEVAAREIADITSETERSAVWSSPSLTRICSDGLGRGGGTGEIGGGIAGEAPASKGK